MDFEKLFFFTKSARYQFTQQFEPLAISTVADRRLAEGRFTERRPRRGYPGPASKGSGMLKANGSGRNRRCVWDIPTRARPSGVDHPAAFPPDLIAIPIRAGSHEGGIVLDPFMGSGTTAVVARKLGRHFLGIELNPEYVAMARKRVAEAERMLSLTRRTAA